MNSEEISLQDIDDRGALRSELEQRPNQPEPPGDETAAGSNPTPDQEMVDEIGAAIGVPYADDEELRFGRTEVERDAHRWELDPASSEDYVERCRRRTDGPGGEVLHMTHRGHIPHGSE